jgi:hypothetical protein
MITLRRAEERGHADHGWLKTWHTVSFADYYDPGHMGFRALRVINDDVIAGGGGFPTHPHRDMEILTYVLAGALEHRDSMGNGSVIRPGQVQYMSAGTGVRHSEFNASPIEPVHLVQIWILPDHKGATPRYAEATLPAGAAGRLHLLASKGGRDGSIAIHQDAELRIARLGAGDRVEHRLQPGRHAWVHVAEGEVTLNDRPLKPGDGASLSDEASARLAAVGAAQVLLFDLN